MSRKPIKICGITTKEIVDFVDSQNIGFMGFVFVKKSPRYITPEIAQEITVDVTNSAIVALVADFSNDEIENLLENFTPDFLQLHGNETVERTLEIKERFMLPIIKAVPIADVYDVKASIAYHNVCDLMLYDAKPPKDNELKGGHGVSFDWSLLKPLASYQKPYFVAGGINSENASLALEESGANYIDLSSGVEETRGVKSKEKIEALLNNTKGYK